VAAQGGPGVILSGRERTPRGGAGSEPEREGDGDVIFATGGPDGRIGATPARRVSWAEKEVAAMIDRATNEPLVVRTSQGEWPYLDVSVQQLDDLRRLLDDHGVRYFVHEDIISFNGGPEIATVNFGRKGDPQKVQTILDNVP
jgi:hypothetical protein